MSAPVRNGILDVVIGADCDPDRPSYGGVRHDSRDAPTWRGIREGVPALREVADGILDDFGTRARITWCVRSDLQMQEIYGDCAWPATEFADLWSDLERAGDELAWHPHVWRWDDDAGCWYQEIEDEDWIAECLSAGHQGFSHQIGHAPVTSRTGWEFHNNATMAQIRRLGVRVDFSAIPGRHNPGSPDRWGSRFNCCVDWRGTPEEPYAPSAADYRIPAEADEAPGLLELPMSVVDSGLLQIARIARKICSGRVGAVGELKNALATHSGGAGGNKLYVTVHPRAFSRLARQQIRQARQNGRATLVTALHPDEMCGGGSALTALYHPAHVKANLKSLLRYARRSGVRVRFTTPAVMLSSGAPGAPEARRRVMQPLAGNA